MFPVDFAFPGCSVSSGKWAAVLQQQRAEGPGPQKPGVLEAQARLLSFQKKGWFPRGERAGPSGSVEGERELVV